MSVVRLLALGLSTALLLSCISVPTPQARRAQALALAGEHGWAPLELHTDAFRLQALAPPVLPGAGTLTVYLEGDGFAWVNRSQPSVDPTPIQPVGLQLALAQPDGRAVYLARPCQYLAEQPACSWRYWGEARFAEEVVASTGQALDQLEARYGVQRLTLVGYSGGAALALLLAERRGDVEQVISVAGNLSPNAWTRYHHLSPLHESLDPSTDVARLALIPQRHLVGAADPNLPPVLAEAFIASLPPGTPVELRVKPGFDHGCCWARDWASDWPSLSQPLRAAP